MILNFTEKPFKNLFFSVFSAKPVYKKNEYLGLKKQSLTETHKGYGICPRLNTSLMEAGNGYAEPQTIARLSLNGTSVPLPKAEHHAASRTTQSQRSLRPKQPLLRKWVE